MPCVLGSPRDSITAARQALDFLLLSAGGRYTRFPSLRKDFPLQFEPRDQFEQRQKKLEQVKALGFDPYPREFRWSDTPAALLDQYLESAAADLEANKREVRVAGRIVSYRLMG